MSLASKLTLLSAFTVTGGIIAYVHYKQNLDLERMHEGVIKDIERQQRRKMQNIYMLEQQRDLTRLYKGMESSNEEGRKEQ